MVKNEEEYINHKDNKNLRNWINNLKGRRIN